MSEELQQRIAVLEASNARLNQLLEIFTHGAPLDIYDAWRIMFAPMWNSADGKRRVSWTVEEVSYGFRVIVQRFNNNGMATANSEGEGQTLLIAVENCVEAVRRNPDWRK